MPPTEDQGSIPFDRYRPTVAAMIEIATKKQLTDRRDRTNIYLSDHCRFNDRYNLWL